MKANNGKGNIESRDLWETPHDLFDKLNFQYHFNFDCCAIENNNKCNWYSDDFEKVIFNPDIIAWINPPFSKALEMFKHFFKVVPKGVAIYRCDNMETKVWQDVILKNATWVFIPKGRISYEGMKGKGSRFPSALIGYNVDTPKGLNGVVLEIKQKDN